MAFSWMSNEFQIDFQWITNGFAYGVLAIWNPFDIQMKSKPICPQMGFRWESPMDLQWIASGVLMQFQRIADGFRMDFTLIFNRFLMGFRWIPMMSPGFQKNFQCISNGVLMANQWISN